MRLLPITAAALAMLALAGCRSADPPATSPTGRSQTAPAPKETWTHELTQDEPWYEHPAQGRPPNGTMRKGTKVRVLNPSGSYTEVLSDDGVRGYVATASLRLL
jgi:hypothetical protein